MNTMIEIIGIVVAILLVAVIVLGAAYAAIVIYNNQRWEKLKSKKYDQYNNNEKVSQV